MNESEAIALLERENEKKPRGHITSVLSCLNLGSREQARRICEWDWDKTENYGNLKALLYVIFPETKAYHQETHRIFGWAWKEPKYQPES